MEKGGNPVRFEQFIKDDETSIVKKYQDLTLGERSLPALIRYELITSTFGSIPGALGLFLRKQFYPCLFRHVGKKTLFGHNITIRSPKNISIGNRVVIDDFAVLSMRDSKEDTIRIGNSVLIGRFSQLKARGGSIIVEDFANIGSSCHIGSTTEVRLGKYCLVARGCYIGGIQHGFDRSDIPIVRQELSSKGGITIEDDVWLGANVVVNDGVTIGKGSVIGAGSVVTKNIPPNKIVVGVPAKILRERAVANDS